MKRATLFASAAIAVMGGIALAQGGDDPMARLRACSLMERTDRLECLDRLSRAVTPAAPPAPKEDRWIISRTMSPLDYSPIATATISSREVAGGSAMQLSIRCRGERTEITVVGAAVSGRGDDYGERTGVWYRRRVQGRCCGPDTIAPGRGRARRAPLASGGRISGRLFLSGRTGDGAHEDCRFMQMAASYRETKQLTIGGRSSSMGDGS
jgi:hypothetical protein